jgi:hypothetical protein
MPGPSVTRAPLAAPFNPLWRRLSFGSSVQAKLTVGAPNDSFEREADSVADRVMRMPEPQVQRKCAACSAGGAPCPDCEKEEHVQRKEEPGGANGAGELPMGFAGRMQGGAPLDVASRAFFEPRFGRDFGDVRVHADTNAATAARSIRARAFTLGRNVAFAAGEYNPQSERGRGLLAHELVHVVQQSHGSAPSRQSHGVPALSRAVPGRIQRALVATGDSAGFASLVNSILSVQQEVVVSPTGQVTLRATQVQGPPTREAAALATVLNRVIGDSHTTTIAFTHGLTTTDPVEQQVIVGSYTLGMIDLDDIGAFGTGEGISSASSLLHEIQEQYRRQVFREGYPVAHASGMAEERNATGATRSTTDRRRQVNATTIEITTPFTYPSGRVVEVTVRLTANNITSVTRNVTTP